jgi:hypothetical protein
MIGGQSVAAHRLGNLTSESAGAAKHVVESRLVGIKRPRVNGHRPGRRTGAGRLTPGNAADSVLIYTPRQVPLPLLKTHLVGLAPGHPDGSHRTGIRLALRPDLMLVSLAIRPKHYAHAHTS